MKKIYILLFIFCTVIFTQSCSSSDTGEPIEETNDDEVDPTDDEIPIPESWQKTIGGNSDDTVSSMVQTADGGFILCGSSYSNISGEKTEDSRGGSDVWVVKLSANGAVEWDKTYGGSELDAGTEILQTTDGGYIVAAYSESNISGDKTEDSQGGPDYWVLKLSSAGNIEWQNTIGGDDRDILKGIVQTPDGGYMLAGDSESSISGDRTLPNSVPKDQWYVKITSTGVIQSQNRIYWPNGGNLNSFHKTNDGGFISGSTINTGTLSVYAYAIDKSNPNAVSTWSTFFNGNSLDYLTDVKQTVDGGFIICGGSQSNASGGKTDPLNGNLDYWIIKINASRDLEWQNSIGGNDTNFGFNVVESNEGGYLVCGYSDSNISGDKTEDSKGFDDYWLVKLNEQGEVTWDKTLGGDGIDKPVKLLQIEDGSYVVVGSSDSNISGDKNETSRGYKDIWILKYTGHL